jgi:pilin isopeptide linkage protein/LPXTG-motif cell wall-anchored protein
MFKRKVKRGLAGVLASSLLITQLITPSLSNLAHAEDLNEDEPTTEEVVTDSGDSSGSKEVQDSSETTSKAEEVEQNLENVEMVEAAELTRAERAISVERVEKEFAATVSSSVGGNNIERFVLEWRTQDNDGKAINLHNEWVNNEEQSVSYKITYAMSGQKDYEVGTVNVRIPKTIFRDRQGNYIGYTTFGVPKAPDNNGYFAYTETDDAYILTNTKKLKAASSGVIEATIRGLKPSEIKDFGSKWRSEALKANLTVTMKEGVMGLESNRLLSTVDTNARIYDAKLSHNPTVSDKFPENWDARLKPSNPDDYYYATFSSYAMSKANQYFDVKLKIDMRASEDAKNAVVLGFKNNRKDEVILGDGTGVFNKDIENNVYLNDGQNFAGVIYVAYPKRDFSEDRAYKLKGNIEYTMTAVDDKQVTKSGDETTLPFAPVQPEKPDGNFYVDKHGDGDIVTWVAGQKKEGIYDTALNKLKARQDVDIRFDIQARAYGGGYTLRDGGDPENLSDYGHKPYKMVFDDYKTTFNYKNEELSAQDFSIKALDFSHKPIVRKFTTLGNGDVVDNNIVNKQFTSGKGQPLFGYASMEDNKIPLIDVYGKVDNSDTWVKYGTVDYRSGAAVITTTNGASVDGTKLVFPANVTDFKAEVETTVAQYIHNIKEIVTVKPSDKIVSQVEELSKTGVTPMTHFANHIKLDVYRDGKHYKYINEYVGRDQLHGFAYGIKPEKKLLKFENDTSKRKVDLEYELSSTIQTNLLSEDSVKKAVQDGWLKEETEGVFYDLLPQGVAPVTNSIEAVRSGDSIVSVKATENYKGSGRTLLEIRTRQTPDYRYEYNGDSSILRTKGYYDKPAVRFKARYSWLNLKTFGAVIPNIMAYGSKHDINSVKGLGTETDPNTGKNTFTKLAFNNEKEKETLKDLDFDGAKHFVYARTDSEIAVDTNSVTSLLKQVDVNNENLWGDGLDESLAKNVYEGGKYNYSLAIKNTDVTKSKDIIFYDNLEKFKPFKTHDDYGDMQWRGTLQGVNVEALRKAGIEPVVYYSTRDDLVLDSDAKRGDMDLSNSSIWTREMPKDKSKIRAIAVDARHKTDGSEFILAPGASLSLTIDMKAPMASSAEWYDTKLQAGQTETGLTGGGHAYNNAVMTARQIATDTGVVSDNLLIRNDYVKVGLKPLNIKVTKEWDDDDNRDGLRQKQVIFELMANGKPTNKTVTLNEGNSWSGEFHQLPFMDKDNNQINYTVVEKNVKGYTLKVKSTEVTDNGITYKMVNKHTPELINIRGEKVWKDVSENTRPKSITVVLKADGREIRKVEVKPVDGKWNYEFKELNKYRDGGTEIKYTVEEKDYISGYYQEVKGYDIVNTYDPYADVVLKKEVENQTDAAKKVNPDFTFVFNLSDSQGNPVMNEYEYETTLGRTGKVIHGKEIKLKAGEEVKIKRVDVENTVTIKEINYPKGYSLVKEENSTETLQAGKTMRTVFTNRYESKGTANIKGTKRLTGREMFPREFRFSLLHDGEVVRTASNDTDGSFDFGFLEYTTADLGKTFVYKVREENNGLGGVTYDKHEDEVRVELVDNGDGTIGTKVTYDRDGAVFSNEYHAKGKVNFKAWKQVLNGFKPEAEQFSFELRDERNNVVATGKNDAGGTVTFSDLNFNETHVGKTFTYIAREVQGNDNKVVYDNSTINYTVTVKDNYDGTLSLVTTARDNKVEDINNEINSPVFVNKYKDGKLTIRKRVTKGDPNKVFTFKVKLKGPEGTVPKGKFTVSRRSLDNQGNPVNEAQRESAWTKLKRAAGNFVDSLKPKDAKAAEGYGPQGSVKHSGVSGTAKWEIYDNGHMVISPVSGSQGVLDKAPNDFNEGWNPYKSEVISISFTGTIKLPTDSSGLLSTFMKVESIDLHNVDTSDVTNMERLFYGNPKLKSLDLRGLDTSKVTNMNRMFASLPLLDDLNISQLNTSKVTDMSSMFERISKLKNLNLDSFDTRNVTNMSKMFYYMYSIENLNVSRFDTSKVTNMSSMFSEMALVKTLELGNFNTVNVTDMREMFSGSSKLTALDVRSFNTGKVTNMSGMFKTLRSLPRLDVSNFNTSKVTDMSGMFSSMFALNTLDISNFDTSQVTNFSDMFSNSGNLGELKLGAFDTNKATNYSRMFSSTSSITELDLTKFNLRNNPNLSGFLSNTYRLDKINLGVNSKPWLAQEVTSIGLFRPVGYTPRWVREDGTFGPLTVKEMHDQWNPAMAGVWVRERDAVDYKINFDTQGTGESLAKITAKKDKDVELPSPTIRKPGTMFKGWSTTPNGNVVSKPARNLTEPNKEITLYAVWEEMDNNVNIANGEFDIKVNGNEQVTLENLPAGLSYEVYEQTEEGWVLVDEVNTSGTIKPNEESIAKFTNEYDANVVTVKLKGQKLLDGKRENAGGYRFTLSDVKGTVLDSVESSEDGTINFKTLKFIGPGSYRYDIKEIDDGDPGIIYDGRVRRVTVRVNYDEQRKLQAQVDDGSVEDLVFENRTRTAQLEVSKEVQGTEDTNKEFTFKVTLNNREENFKLRAGQKKILQDIPIGTRYKVEEINLPDGYSLSSITNAEGVLTEQSIIEVKATNKYNVNGSVALQAKKVLRGKELTSGQFTFELLDSTGKVLDTVKNDGSGDVYFNALPLSRAGVFNYKIREVRGSENGITYDTHEETVRVNVTDDGRGTLTPQVTYDADGAVFTNSYTPQEVPPTVATSDVTITKKLEGITSGRLFNVKVEVLKDGKPLENKFNYTSSVAGKNGSLVSGDKVGIQGNEVITITKVPVGATVKITEDEYKGFYIKEGATLEKVVQTSGNALELTNVYEAKGDLTLKGKKALRGGKLSDYRFKFLVLRDGKVVQEAMNDNEGNINFTPMYFTNKDIGQTYEYEVVEDKGSDEQIVYDKTVYKVKVKVEDNGDGTLKLTSTVDQGDIVFNNIVQVELPLTGTEGTIIVLGGLLSLLVVGYVRRRKQD